MPLPEPTPDIRALQPPDAVLAVRSLPRRWRGVLNHDEELLARSPSAGGPSADELGRQAATVLAGAAQAVRRMQVDETPTIGADPPPASTESAAEAVSQAAAALSEVLDGLRGADWQRRGVKDGTEVDTLDVTRHAVHAGVWYLKEADRTVAAVRAEWPDLEPGRPGQDDDANE